MTKTRSWPITGVTQQIAWWTFLVSSLFAGGVTWLGGRAGRPLVAEGGSVVYHGSYQPLYGVPMSKAYETSLEIDMDIDSATTHVAQAVSLTSFAILMITSITMAVLLRRPIRAAGAVAVPIVAATIVAVALPADRWSTGLDNTWAMVAVLAAVGVHLVGTHLLRTRYGPTNQDV